jgi:magnesium transporter
VKYNHSRKRKHPKIHRRTQPGASPGSVVADPAASPSQIRVLSYGPESCHEEMNATLAMVKESISHFAVTWVNVEGLRNTTLIEELGEMFHLHRLALEDVVNVHQRAKVEEYNDVIFFVAPMAASIDPFVSEQVSLFVRPHVVLTFQEGHPGDSFEAVRERIRTNSGKIRQNGSDYLMYALIDALLDSYFPALEKYGERLDQLEEEITRDIRKVTLIDELHDIRSNLRHIRRAIWPQREALAELLRNTDGNFSELTRVHLRDCSDHVFQLIDLLETYRELTADLRDLHMSSISNRINETMRVLTIISTIFIPLTFIAGVYGMNFDPDVSPWNMPELKWVYGYPFSLLLMVVSAVFLTAYFFRMGWIRLWKKA